MKGLADFLLLSLQARYRRIAGVVAFGLLFLLAGATARIFTTGPEGHVEMERLFELGGTTLVSVLLLLGWLIGRFPTIAALVLMHGIFSDDRAAGHTRLYAARPRSLLLLYGARFVLLALIAFVLSALVMPGFDLLILGSWTGWSIFVLMGAQILIFGSLTALLSTATRFDAWGALFLGILALVWDALRRADFIAAAAPPVRAALSVLLPPQGAMLRIEAAFVGMQPVPWDAFLYIVLYATLTLLIAGAVLVRRQL